MRYQGSKLKMKNVLRTVIEANLKPQDTYVEPFMGGCNSLAYINCNKKITCDTNKYVVDLWKGLRDGSFIPPKEVSEEEYNDIKQDYLNGSGRYSDALIGYVATACSFGGAWFNGYAHYNPKKHENHILEAYNGLQKQVKNFVGLKDTVFICGSYDELELPEDCVIYCDPPYSMTKEYANSFDSEAFYQWARELSIQGKKVLFSEYNAPDDFVCIWSKDMQDGMKAGNGKKVEKLFIHKSLVDTFIIPEGIKPMVKEVA